MRKIAYCEGCGVDGIFDSTHTEEGEPVWKCRCCNTETKRRVLKTKSKEIRREKEKKNRETFEALISGKL